MGGGTRGANTISTTSNRWHDYRAPCLVAPCRFEDVMRGQLFRAIAAIEYFSFQLTSLPAIRNEGTDVGRHFLVLKKYEKYQ